MSAQIMWETKRPDNELAASTGISLRSTFRGEATDRGDHIEFYSERGAQRVDVPMWVIEAILASRK